MADSPGLVGEQFGRNLRAARKRAEVSQEDLGWLATLNRTEIGLLEHGRRVPRIDTLIKLATALSVQPGSLLEGIDFVPDPDARRPRPRSGRFSIEPGKGTRR